MELAVLTLVAPSVRFWPKYNATNPIDWTPERICLTQVVWRTQPCEVGDVGDAPRMLTPGAQLWLDQKGARASSRQWWCAQRQHLSGVARLVQTAPNASWYLTLDTDTLIFPRPLAKLLELLERQLAPAEDLYTGHLHITLLSDTDPLASKIRPFIATGGGALIRGRTLRKLRDNFVLDRFTREQGHGELRWAALDWVLGAALLAVGVQPRGHAAFQQHTYGGGECRPPRHVACHPASFSQDRLLRLKEMGAMPSTMDAGEQRRWAMPCAVGSFPEDWRVSSCSPLDEAAAKEARLGRDVEIQTMSTDKVFNLGAGKTGTTTIAAMLSFLLCNRCATDAAQPTRWGQDSLSHNGSGVLESHQCFSGNGEQADFRWLERRYPRARFVLSVRHPQEWSTSLFNHLRKVRLAANCTEVGTAGSCAAVPFSGNLPQTIAARARAVVRHNEEVLRHFNQSQERRDRFIRMDVSLETRARAWPGLLWLIRPDLREFPADQLVGSPNLLPAAFRRSMEAHEIKHVPMPHASFKKGSSPALLGSTCYKALYHPLPPSAAAVSG